MSNPKLDLNEHEALRERAKIAGDAGDTAALRAIAFDLKRLLSKQKPNSYHNLAMKITEKKFSDEADQVREYFLYHAQINEQVSAIWQTAEETIH